MIRHCLLAFVGSIGIHLQAMQLGKPLHTVISPQATLQTQSRGMVTGRKGGSLSYEEIRDAALKDFDLDLRNIEHQIDGLGIIPGVDEARAIVDQLRLFVRDIQQGDVEANAAITNYASLVANLIADREFPAQVYRAIEKLFSKLIIYRSLQKLGIVGLPVPDQGSWREIHAFIRTICHANNMPIPKVYYGQASDLGHMAFIAKVGIDIAQGGMQGSALPQSVVAGAEGVYIFIDQDATKNLSLDVLKGIVAHELGHLYYGDIDLDKGLREQMLIAEEFSSDFKQKYKHAIEHRADSFAALYGFGRPLALLCYTQYVQDQPAPLSFVQELKKKWRDLWGLKHESAEPIKISTHPDDLARIKSIFAGTQESRGFINVPHLWSQESALAGHRPIAFNNAMLEPYVSSAKIAKTPSMLWSQRPYPSSANRGAKKIDLSAQPADLQTVGQASVERKDLNFAPILAAAARKQAALQQAAHLLKRVVK